MEPIIEIKGVGKKYNIAHQKGGYIALRDVLANALRNPFSFAKHKAKKMIGMSTQEDFWALKDVNVQIERGDVVGIIGKNGSGKSTLLKILTGITPPTEGEIIMRGRAASLLEVGTGFHPELTGRENVFLNGAILGMPQKEIAQKFNDIVAFAGVEKFLDTPVKRYSSGMYVRLAFSVAAHMEPDILLVDEVLAVGDADFQKKCLGKMEEVTKKDGRTILFVSHNMTAIQALCKKTVLIENGKVKMFGETEQVIKHYLERAQPSPVIEPHKAAKEVKIHRVVSKNESSDPWLFRYGQEIKLEVTLESYLDIPNFQLGLGIDMLSGERVTTARSETFRLEKGLHSINVAIQNPLAAGSYGLSLYVPNILYLNNVATLQITTADTGEKVYQPLGLGVIDVSSSFAFK
jgi:lipopolysaccharide transport system ATP-binding protein